MNNQKLGDSRWQLLQKEIDLIDGTIKNLDDIIHKSKNFAFLFWGGSLYLIVQHLATNTELNINIQSLIFCTGVIPLVFWVMGYRWRMHLRFSGERQKITSRFINSTVFPEWLLGNEKLGKKFPLLDPVGWIYTKDLAEEDQAQFGEEYLINRKMYGFLDFAFYKEAKWFYSTMIAASLMFAYFWSPFGFCN